MTKIARIALGAVLAAGLAGTGQAVTITDAPSLSPEDRQAVNTQEADFFNRLERDGAEKTVASLFPSVAANDPAMAAMKELDRDCGTVTKVDRYKTVNFGTRAVRDEFMVVMGSCMVKWDLTFLKPGVAWKLNNAQFNSRPGEW